MKNSLLKDSTFQKRYSLESVRSYLDQEGKNVSIIPAKLQLPTNVPDSPPRSSDNLGRGGFGSKFRKLLQSQPKEEPSILIKRKCRTPIRSPVPDHREPNLITPVPKEKRTRISNHHSPLRARPPPPSRESAFLKKPKLSATLFEEATISQPQTIAASVGFSSSSWRDRIQIMIAKGTNPPPSKSLALTPTTADSEPQRNFPPASSTRISEEPSVDPAPAPRSRRNLVPAKSEVSSNFVRKDLKGRGSYKFKSGNNARRAKSRDFRRGREGASLNSNLQTENPDDTVVAPKERRSSGLTVFGLDPFHLYLESSTRKKLQVKATDSEFQTTDSEIPPPLCPGHQMAAKLLTVKKSGLNKGKKFYACSYPYDQRCNFFLWEQDNPNIFLRPLPSTTKSSEVRTYLQSTVLLFRNRLLDFDLFELRAEVARVNHILKENGFDWKLSTNGKKEDMIQALVSAITKLFPAEDVEVMGPELDIGRECLPQLTPSEGLPEGDIILDDSLSEISHVELSDAEEEAGPRRNTLVASSDMEQEDLVLQALRRSFALSSLKCGQEWAINRVLSNQRSLLILPTGAGKSLTFLLPSLLCCPRDGVTIVISPLVALMRDQMRKLPFNLPAACLSGEVTATEAAKICADLVAGYLRIIFISPERLCSPSFLRLIRSLRRSTRAPCQKLSDDLSAELTGPGVGLLCIDEGHCLSQWSFNFRPSFLRIKREIQRIQPKSVLALTATAPSHVQRDIQLSLGIPDDGVFFIPPHRPNLELASEFINGEDEKREMILQALKKNSESKKRQCPTIIYVWRRDEADTLSQFLQVEGIAAKGYHAGMSSSQRMRIQHLFYRGNLDVVVATIAFGMGIDKPNIRLVIHHSMPKDIESYLQEIGRAGRDGLPSRCLLLLSTDDFLKHHSFAYSPTLATAQLYLLLKRIFIPMPTGRFFLQETIALDLDGSADDLDISAALIETIVSYLEEHESVCLVVEESRYDRITGKLKVSVFSEQSTSLVQAISTLNKISTSPQNQSDFEVSLLALSSHLQLSPEETSAQLFNQQNRGILLYKLSRKCLYLTIEKQPSLSSVDGVETWLWKLANSLSKLLKSKLQAAAERVQDVWRIGKILANESDSEERGRQFLHDYMTDGSLDPLATSQEPQFPNGFIHRPYLHSSDLSAEDSEDLLKCKRQIDILLLDPSLRDILQRFHFSGSEEMTDELRAVTIAKILHGVQSSQIRAADWEHRAQWNSCRMISFPTILSLCQPRTAAEDSGDPEEEAPLTEDEEIV